MKILISILLISSFGIFNSKGDVVDGKVIFNKIVQSEVIVGGCWVKNKRGRYYWFDDSRCSDFSIGTGESCWDCCPDQEGPGSLPTSLSAPIRVELRDDENGGTVVWDLDSNQKIATLNESGKSKFTIVREIITTSFKKQEKDGKTYIVSDDKGEKVEFQLSKKGKKKLKGKKEVTAIEIETKD